MKPISSIHRWLGAISLFALIAVLAAGALALPRTGAPTSAPAATVAYAPPTDPNFKDPDWGAPKDPLPKKVAGWASNQDTRKPKEFPHYGRMEFKLCDLPYDKEKGGHFNKWTDAQQRSWCRSQLNTKFGMTADYTNHELVEEKPDGNGGTMKVLAVYKVWKTDHEKTGRGKLYHPRYPGQENYYGGISQMKDLADHLFKKAKPAKKSKDKNTSVETGCTELCEVCVPCAQSAEDAAAWCGDGDGELYCPIYEGPPSPPTIEPQLEVSP